MEKVGIYHEMKFVFERKYGEIKNPFGFCKNFTPERVFRVAYNIWKPFVYKKAVTNYSLVGTTEVLEGIDIEVIKKIFNSWLTEAGHGFNK